jgi:hypothetical protein
MWQIISPKTRNKNDLHHYTTPYEIVPGDSDGETGYGLSHQ